MSNNDGGAGVAGGTLRKNQCDASGSERFFRVEEVCVLRGSWVVGEEELMAGDAEKGKWEG